MPTSLLGAGLCAGSGSCFFGSILLGAGSMSAMLGCNGDGNFKFEKTVFETDADSTLVPSTIILSHENDEIKSFKLEIPEGQPDDLLSYFEL